MITISLPAATGWKQQLPIFFQPQLEGGYNLLVFTNNNWMEAPTPQFSSSCNQKEDATSCLYQHLLDGSSNYLVLRHQPKDSYNHLSCTTLPPYNIDQFLLYFCLQCLYSSSLFCILPLSFHSHCLAYLVTIVVQLLIFINIYFISQSGMKLLCSCLDLHSCINGVLLLHKPYLTFTSVFELLLINPIKSFHVSCRWSSTKGLSSMLSSGRQ